MRTDQLPEPDHDPTCPTQATRHLTSCECGAADRILAEWRRVNEAKLERLAKARADLESFTCPDCGRTSYHPEDRRFGYCGACHAYTGAPAGQAASRER